VCVCAVCVCVCLLACYQLLTLVFCQIETVSIAHLHTVALSRRCAAGVYGVVHRDKNTKKHLTVLSTVFPPHRFFFFLIHKRERYCRQKGSRRLCVCVYSAPNDIRLGRYYYDYYNSPQRTG
jgi:hypothetical protein